MRDGLRHTVFEDFEIVAGEAARRRAMRGDGDVDVDEGYVDLFGERLRERETCGGKQGCGNTK